MLKTPSQTISLTKPSNEEKQLILSEARFLPDGYKLNRGQTYNNKKNHRNFTLSHSIVIIQQKVYWLTRELIGYGGFGRVKTALCLNDDESYVLKIELSEEGNMSESVCLEDLSMQYGATIRYYAESISHAKKTWWCGATKKKYDYKIYTVMPYLGESLKSILTAKLIMDKERWQIAIEACWEVAQLHMGIASESRLEYAHLDIKPGNFVRSKQVKVVDYGVTQQNIHKFIDKPHGGTHGYFPTQAHFSSIETLEPWQYDIFALKRVIYFPTHDNSAVYILSSDIFVKHLNLLDYFDTGTLDKHKNITALELTALLILEQAGIKATTELHTRLAHTKELALCIVGNYWSYIVEMTSSEQNKHLSELLTWDTQKLTNDALLVSSGLATHLVQARNHDSLVLWMQRHDKVLQHAAAELLKKHRWHSDTELLLTNAPNLAPFIISACRRNNLDILSTLLSHQHVAQAIKNIQPIVGSYFIQSPSLAPFIICAAKIKTLKKIALVSRLTKNIQPIVASYFIRQYFLPTPTRFAFFATNTALTTYNDKFITTMIKQKDNCLLLEQIQNVHLTEYNLNILMDIKTPLLIEWIETHLRRLSVQNLLKIINEFKLYVVLMTIWELPCMEGYPYQATLTQLFSAQSNNLCDIFYLFAAEKRRAELFRTLIENPHIIDSFHKYIFNPTPLNKETDTYANMILSPSLHPLPDLLVQLPFTPNTAQLTTLMQWNSAHFDILQEMINQNVDGQSYSILIDHDYPFPTEKYYAPIERQQLVRIITTFKNYFHSPCSVNEMLHNQMLVTTAIQLQKAGILTAQNILAVKNNPKDYLLLQTTKDSSSQALFIATVFLIKKYNLSVHNLFFDTHKKWQPFIIAIEQAFAKRKFAQLAINIIKDGVDLEAKIDNRSKIPLTATHQQALQELRIVIATILELHSMMQQIAQHALILEKMEDSILTLEKYSYILRDPNAISTFCLFSTCNSSPTHALVYSLQEFRKELAQEMEISDGSIYEVSSVELSTTSRYAKIYPII